MNLKCYQERIRPEHWEEFQKLLPEEYRVKNDDFTILGKQMAESVEKQMSIKAAWEYAAKIVAEKYDYDETEEDEEDLY